MFIRLRTVSMLLSCSIVLLAFAACSGNANTGTLVPQISQARGGPGVRLSSSSSPESFASLVGKDITDTDIERFIDKEIVGADREFAKKLMRSMPKNARGDFVYISQSGTILSNRLVIRDSFVREDLHLPNDPRPFAKQPDSYPPPPTCCMGPYIREYSQVGVTATTAYVFVPCGDSIFNSGDEGVLYSGGFGESTSAIDAGLQYNNDLSIQPFIFTNYPPNASWANQSQHYQCNTHLLFAFGPLLIRVRKCSS
jgi:hypothetical protein